MHLGFDLLFLLPGEGGGRETYSRELLRALRAARPELSVTTFVNADTAAHGGGFWSELADRSVVIGAASARSRARWAAGEVVALPVAAGRARVDLLHSPANVGPLHGRFRRVLTLHDLLFTRRSTRSLAIAAAHRAHALITGSQASREELARCLRLPAARLSVIHHGVTMRAGRTDKAIRERLHAGARPLALVVGADVGHKNLDAALQGLARLDPDERPVMALAGRGTDGPSLRSRAAALGVLEDVRLLGTVPEEVLDALYAAAALLLSPSRGEGFGLTVIEAMAHGVPVACSDIPVMREVAGDAAAFFAPEDPGAVSAAIRRLSSDGAEARRLRTAGAARAAHFTWEAAARQTLDVYERALERR
jgi:glycosyltransferase involved in cell wall biosynthesis